MLKTLTLLLVVLWGTASAAPLTEDSANRFVNVMERMKAFEEENGEFDLEFMGDGDPAELADKMLGPDGQIRLVSSIAKELEAHPEAGPTFKRSVRQEGFPSTAAFAQVGDALVAAVMRSEMGPEELRDMRAAANMSDAEKAFIPKPMLPMLERLSAMAEAIEAVPDSDVAVAEKVRPRLDALGEE